MTVNMLNWWVKMLHKKCKCVNVFTKKMNANPFSKQLHKPPIKIININERN